METKIIALAKSAGDSTFEDRLAVIKRPDDLVIAAFDGRKAWAENGDAEGLRQEGGCESTGQFCAQFAADMVENECDFDLGPAALMIKINRLLGDRLRARGYDLNHPECLPGCAGIIIKVNSDGSVEFANLLDTRLILFNLDGDFIVPTIDHMDRWDRIALKIAAENARQLGVSVRQAIFEIDYAAVRPDLTDPRKQDAIHRRLENVDLPAGLGVLNGMPSMERFMQTGKFPIGPFSHLLVCTDGLSFPTPLEQPASHDQLIRFLIGQSLDSLDSLVAEIRKQEDSDPENDLFPRFARRRDIAAVLVEIGH